MNTIYKQIEDKTEYLLDNEPQFQFEINNAIYIDYRDDINHHASLIDDCLEEGCAYPLHDKFKCEWYYEQIRDAVNKIYNELILMLPKYFHCNVLSEFFEKNWGEDVLKNIIENKICDNDNELKTLLRRSSLYGRISLQSNYEALVPSYDWKFTYDCYLKDILDTLQINPRIFADLYFSEEEDRASFPDLWERNGKNVVDIQNLCNLLNETSCVSLLTFIGQLPLQEMYENCFYMRNITIPAGTTLLMYNHWNGCGSLTEILTIKDFNINLENKQYPYFKLMVDHNSICGYSTYEVYGERLSKDILFNVSD